MKVPAKWIIYYPQEENQEPVFLENMGYNPEDEINNGAWGVIKIKKEALAVRPKAQTAKCVLSLYWCKYIKKMLDTILMNGIIEL